MSFSRYFLITSCFVCVFVGTTTTMLARVTEPANQQAAVNKGSQKADSNRDANTGLSSEVKVVAEIFEEGIPVVNRGNIDECVSTFEKILEDCFDFEYMFDQAYKGYLKNVDDETRKLAKAFTKNYLIFQYLSTFLKYRDVKYKIAKSSVAMNGTDFCMVRSYVKSGEKKTSIHWTLKKGDGGAKNWKVVDVSYKGPNDGNFTSVKALLDAGIRGSIRQMGLKKFVGVSVENYGGLDKNGEQDFSRVKAKLSSVTH